MQALNHGPRSHLGDDFRRSRQVISFPQCSRRGTRVSLSEPKVEPRRKLDVAGRVFRVAGVLILVVAGSHLLAAPLFGRFMAEAVGSEAWKVVGPPSLLSFIVLGILLIPVGAGAFTVAPAGLSACSDAGRDVPSPGFHRRRGPGHDCGPHAAGGVGMGWTDPSTRLASAWSICVPPAA